MKRRVVITGMGAVSPVGNDVSSMWESIKNGKNGIDFIKSFDTSNNRVKIAGEVKDLNPDLYLTSKEYRKLDRCMLLGLIAATQAYKDASLEDATIDPYRFGTFVTSGIGGIETIFEQSKVLVEKGPERVSPFFIPSSIINLVGGNIAIKFNAKGANIPVVTACSAGTNAIGEAFRYIRDGYLELAFAGGTEAPINQLAVGGFSTMKALCFTNDPENASIPFDKNRSGFVMAEGSGVLILEELDHALARGAKIYAEIVGYGSTCDAYHITAPDESAEGIARSITNALDDAGISGDLIDMISPHGTSTYYNDRLETKAFKMALNDNAYKVNISATKSMTGHALGAIGAIEAIISVKAINEGLVPPTINHKENDPDCDLNYTLDVAVKRDINYVLSNNVGFGGQNAAIILKKY